MFDEKTGAITSSYAMTVEGDDVTEDNVDLLDSVLVMGMELGKLGAAAYLVSKFKDLNASHVGDAQVRDMTHMAGLMREVDVTNGYITMGNMAHETFIKVNKDASARVVIPVQRDLNLGFSLSNNYTRSDYYRSYAAATEQAQTVVKRLEEMFGKDFWDIDKGVSISIPCSRKLFSGLELSGIDDDADNINATIDYINAIHIILPKAGSAQRNRKVRNLKQAKELGEDIDAFKYTVVGVRKMTIAVEIDLAPAHVQYVTQNMKPNAVELGIFLTSKIRGVCLDTEEPECYMSPAGIAKMTAKMAKTKRVNDMRLTINSSGIPMYIPLVNNAEGFVRELEAAGTTTAMGWTLSSAFADTEGKGAISNKVVFTDEVNSFLSYINNGEVVSMELADCVPFEAQHATQYATTTIVRESAALKGLDAFSYYLSRNPDVIDKIEVDPEDFAALMHPVNGNMLVEFGNIYYSPKDAKFAADVKNMLRGNNGNGISSYLKEATRCINRLRLQYQWESERNDDFELPESHDWVDKYDIMDYNLGMLAPGTPVRFLRPLADLLQALAAVVVKDPLANVESRSIMQGCIGVGFAFYVTKYLNRMPEVEKQAKAYLDTLNLPRPVTTWKAPALPGVSKSFAFLPHQGGVQQKLATNPRYIILAVDAGGGKTLLAATKAIKLIYDGDYKKPLVICPDYLIANYVQDLITLTEGRWNIIPITRSTLAAHGEAQVFAQAKNAPPNTLFVTSYNFVKGSVIEVPYGTSTMTVSENSNYLRDIGFDCAFLDESHIVKNPNSQTTIAALKLISSMRMIALMSGTVIHGGAQDLYSQVMLLDPTVFGSWEDFKREYADDWKGDKITLWKPGAERRMMEKIKSRIAYIQVKKREWSALLPKRIERFHEVNLTDAQRKVYKAVLEAVLEDIYNDPAMKKRISEASADQEDFELESKLNTYLARIEKFLAAPATDPLADLLTGEDAVSPKVAKIAQIIHDHWRNKIPGKIIIFTSYVPSAEEIYNHMPADIRKRTILYKAETKDRDKAIFMGDDNYQVMVGVEHSLNTGHNFQHASRIIRVESVWNPGTLEQAESRIFRPDVKNKFGITEKYLDWVLCNGTIDVTKAARLMSKILWNVAIEEVDNPVYAGLPQVELVSMNLDNIASNNDWVKELSQHLEAYKAFRDAQNEDFAAYKKLPGILTEPFRVPSAPMMPGAAFIDGVPYIENHTLPFQEELGLQTFSEYAASQNEGYNTIDATGLWVHTEFGDGVVVKSYTSTLRVRLRNGDVVSSIAKEKTFVFADQKAAAKEKKSVRERLRARLELPVITVTPDQLKNAEQFLEETDALDPDLKTEVNEEAVKPAKAAPPKAQPAETKKDAAAKKDGGRRPNPNTDTEKNGAFSLWCSAINGQITVAIDDDDPDTPDADVLESLGFKFSGKYAYARIGNRAAMSNLVNFVRTNVTKGNIVVSPTLMDEMFAVQQAWEQSKTKAKTVAMLSATEMRNYYMMRIRKPKDPKTVVLTFLVQDDELYAVVDLEFATRGKVFTSKRVQGLNWDTSDGEWMTFFRKKSDAKAFVRELRSSYTINNLDDFKEQMAGLTVTRK